MCSVISVYALALLNCIIFKIAFSKTFSTIFFIDDFVVLLYSLWEIMIASKNIFMLDAPYNFRITAVGKFHHCLYTNIKLIKKTENYNFVYYYKVRINLFRNEIKNLPLIIPNDVLSFL